MTRGGSRAPRGRAYSLVEVAVSTVVVGLMLVAALEAVGSSRVGMRHLGDRTRAMLLAQDLMAEILQTEYCDPNLGPTAFGLAIEEAAPGNRSLYDDVDDYDGWAASPPEHKDGTPIAWATDYKRLVYVDWVSPTDLSLASGSPTGVKRIIVDVERDGVRAAQLVAIRTEPWVPPERIARELTKAIEPIPTGLPGPQPLPLP